MKHAIIIGFAALLGVASFAQQGSQRAEHQDCLLVAPFATEVKYAEFQGRDQVTYTVQESYPATDVLAFISDSLRKKTLEAASVRLLESSNPVISRQRMDWV